MHFKFIAVTKKSTKDRLLAAALDLFAERGVTETTTKAVAERAQVNEVTLFRYFGNKHGLLLAVMEDAAIFARLGKALVEPANAQASFSQTLKEYSRASLQSLTRVQKLIHSLIGEADRYPLENRLALGRGLMQTNQSVAQSLAKAIAQEGLQSYFPPEQLASLLHGLLLGYFTIQSTSEGNVLWEGREEFLESLVALFLRGAVVSPAQTPAIAAAKQIDIDSQGERVADLPAYLVRSILQRAKKLGRQHYALAYIAFGAGLSVPEILHLERSHSISETQQHLLQINWGAVRQVPLNQWILGKRYGSGGNNPLTQWLRNRKDDRPNIFIDRREQPLSEAELQNIWQAIAENLLTPQGRSPTIEQARQTWCVEMLMKGMELENLSLLSGMSVEQLQPFAQRAREKAAIEAAQRLDRKAE